MIRFLIGLAILCAAPAAATTYFDETTTCPVGGQRFNHPSVGSYTTWGELPDGLPLGTGPFPFPRTECPSNGLVLYREFDKATAARLAPFVNSAEYSALRKTETQSYRAYWLARNIGDEDNMPWLLLAATWEAKVAPNDLRLERYQGEFIKSAAARPVDAKNFESIALRARSANALRELGRFEDAEALRASIVIATDAGGIDADAAQNRKGWSDFVKALAEVIRRHDANHAPIDMIGDREAAFRCATPRISDSKDRYPALNEFEQQYCKRGEIAHLVDEIVKANRTN